MTKFAPSIQRIVLSATTVGCLASFSILSPQLVRSQDIPQPDQSPAATDEITPTPEADPTPGAPEADPTPEPAAPNSGQTISPTTVEESSDAIGGADSPAPAAPTGDVAPADPSDPAPVTPTTPAEEVAPQPVRGLW
ncbi:hypothetical protein [Acaryochloris sp. CCMEE 5410]|uniref:hypothetical protein n=1 Tax=Acaryochloris sp. CCMEE 5410 TaxID=310037 RepID=UPI000248395F|nr:hypothetical protein [Acaryochloris sp. CCMEE 5410]KAI9132207.1 hypothetical protein ON05_001610 [Acaryochloris sp. CCMEE 5410]